MPAPQPPSFSHRAGDFEIVAEWFNGRPQIVLRNLRFGPRFVVPFVDGANVAAGIDRAVSFHTKVACGG